MAGDDRFHVTAATVVLGAGGADGTEFPYRTIRYMSARAFKRSNVQTFKRSTNLHGNTWIGEKYANNFTLRKLIVNVKKGERSNDSEKVGAVTMSSEGWVSTALSYEGYPYSYTCEREDEASNTPVVSTTIFFDFEFVLPDPEELFEEVFVQDLPKVEYGILNQLIKVTGVHKCDLEKQLTDPWLQDNYVGDPTVLVLGLTSFEPDTVDPIGKSARSGHQLARHMLRNFSLLLPGSTLTAFHSFFLKETASLLQTWLKV
jgi:hypothetical protein